MGSTLARTCGSVTLPCLTAIATRSVSPATLGAARLRRSAAWALWVPDNLVPLAYRLPVLDWTPTRIARAISQAANTTSRCRTHQRARDRMTSPLVASRGSGQAPFDVTDATARGHRRRGRNLYGGLVLQTSSR